ncbi:MAG: CehA/McbA family metallohydrolase, partial [Chloroflexota bacterium]|nr:CehA/McbA family metallohydrolase [Chloroflexota bacterium]
MVRLLGRTLVPMSDDGYRVVDLSVFRNAGTEVLPGEQPSTGLQRLRGLPFQIGDAERAFIGFGDGLGGTLTIPIESAAHSVLVAHRLLDSNVDQGAPVGMPVADYVFHVEGGATVRVPVRERFEISAMVDFGQLPFLCESDTPDWLLPRWAGAWDRAGERQTEVNRGCPRTYFLWCWTNPMPERRIDSLEVVPHGARFVIAAITLGVTDEYPFVRDAAVPVRIDLKEPELAARPLNPSSDLRLTIDRGVAGYAYSLPVTRDERFVGWGQPSNPGCSPAYARIAAVASASLSVCVANDVIGTVRWGDLAAERKAETPRIALEVVEDGRNWVETVVLDDETGRPVACRIHFESAQGVPYQPHAHHDHVNSGNATWHIDVGGDLRLGGLSYAYIDGRCQGWLPRGEVIVDAARGYEYEPLRQRVTIAPGQRRLELRLRRWTNMNQQRWFSGDTHVHFLSTQGSLREAQCEDLNVVNLLQSQWGNLFSNTEDFTGEPVTSRDGRTVVWTNQENRQHMLGHLILLGLREPVYPWCSDGPAEAEPGGSLETTLSAWADACHAQGGTVILPHFPNPNAEPATLVATGRADAVEMINSRTYNHLEYYRYLNSGYRLPLVGGTDKMSSDVAVGQYRTYVFIPSDEEFSYASWTRNLRLGRTVMSGGPLLEFSIGGAQVGDMVRLPAG